MKNKFFYRKVVFITGVSRGIGKSIMITLGKSGFFIIGTSTKIEGVDFSFNFLSEYGIDGVIFKLNLINIYDIKNIYNILKKKYMLPLILINNAAINIDSFFIKMDYDKWKKVIDINLNSSYLLIKKFLPHMILQKWGRIINISSVVAFIGNKCQVNYASSKLGLVGLSRSLAKEISQKNITINLIAPGFINTDMVKTLSNKNKLNFIKMIPIGVFGSTFDISYFIDFLISDKAKYINGQTIHINGGLYFN